MSGWPSEIIQKLSGVVGAAAPLLGTALGSPLAGVAISLIANAFGVKTNDISGLLTAINSDPSSAVKLKQIEAEHEEILANISAKTYEIEYEDRKDARASAHAGNYEWFVHLLTVTVTGGFFGCIALVFLTKADGTDHDILNMMLGSLGTTWVQIISYYFGNIRK